MGFWYLDRLCFFLGNYEIELYSSAQSEGGSLLVLYSIRSNDRQTQNTQIYYDLGMAP